MRHLRAAWMRVLALVARRRLETEFDIELRSHLQMHVDDNLRAGMTPDAARRDALIKLGGVSPTKERYRDRSGVPFLETLARDARYAVRILRRSPGFTAVAVLSLALGIGTNTAMFSVVNAVLLRALPYANAERLIVLWAKIPANPRTLLTYGEYRELREQTRSFDSLAVWLSQSVNLTGVDEPARITGAFVSASFFDVLNLKAERGVLFAADDTEPGSAKPVVVLSHQFWQRHFATAPSAIGATLTLNGTPLLVVGVVASPFDLVRTPARGWFIDSDVFIPVGLMPGGNSLAQVGPSLIAIGRLKAGTLIDTARAELGVIEKRLLAAAPAVQAGRSIEAESMQESIVGDSRTTLLLLFASVGAVLLIACVNISNLWLARAVDRQREVALRTALGASRLAIIRQLATEIGVLAAGAAALGLLIARWVLDALVWLQPPALPIPETIRLDGVVLLFTLVTAVIVAFVCGLTPAIKTLREDPHRALQAGSPKMSSSGRARDAMVVIEIVLSVALVATSGLLIRSMLAAERVELGFDPSNVLTLQFRLPPSRYAAPEDIARFFRRAIEQVRAVPGVESAALARAVPLSGNRGSTSFAVEGRPAAPGAELQASYHLVTPEYFRTMRIPILRGRDFSDRDTLTAPPVAVVNSTFARAVWPGGDPIGQRITTTDHREGLTVIGVVGDARQVTVSELPQPQLYVSHYQLPLIFSSLVARTRSSPDALASEVRRAIWSVDKDQPLWAVQSLDAIVERSQGPWRFPAMLLGIFAGLALLLAGIGIYGVTAYSVAQRTHEIGIRLALGASGARVRRDILTQDLWLTSGALVAGLGVALAAGRVASTVLFRVSPGDPMTLIASAGLLALVSFVARYVPARRATRVDPLIALRHE